ncbi:MAG: metal-dependent transcriptional regulator [Lachnospiraceae bacterium]|nr:metal-dependent transcriptional regulator [Lachnospiraceae bacterium]
MHESGEMYLETIYRLSQKGGSVRSIDISEEMGFSKPSVSRAVGILKKDGYIQVSAHGAIELTSAGKLIAANIYERHTVLTELLKRIGVPEEIASEDACRVEHYISDETFQAIKKFCQQKASL